jgi:hypothetical protein
LNGPKKWDNARQRVLADKSALVLIQKDIAAQGWHDKNLKVEATTITAPPTLLTREEAARISDTITFNHIWLEHRIQEGGLFFSDETFEKMKKKGALAELKKEWKDGKRATPIDSLIEDLSVTLHHEVSKPQTKRKACSIIRLTHGRCSTLAHSAVTMTYPPPIRVRTFG